MEEPAIGTLTASEAAALAKEAFLYGLPPVCLAAQIGISGNTPDTSGLCTPFNQFAHRRGFPDADKREAAGINVDTLYSFARLDLAKEPVILSVPETGARYWIMQLINLWNDVPHAPGSRTLDGRGGRFAITGPGWKGRLPRGLTEMKAGTNLAILIGRTYVSGEDDFPEVHRIQDQYRLTPLSKWGKSLPAPGKARPDPNVDIMTPLTQQIMAMAPQAFFGRLNALLEDNPPYPADKPVLERLERIDVKPGATFDLEAFPDEIRKAIEAGVAAGRKAVTDGESELGETVNGWRVMPDLGRYGTRYAYRAVVAFFAMGANLAVDAVCPCGLEDDEGRRLDGANRYLLRFAKGTLPPVKAFWSVTLYDAESYLVPNPINRFALGDRSDLEYGDDGSLSIWIQGESPGPAKLKNWLPAPKSGPFKIVMRLYAPEPGAAQGIWAPPAVKRI
jgi:hypothetical protein